MLFSILFLYISICFRFVFCIGYVCLFFPLFIKGKASTFYVRALTSVCQRLIEYSSIASLIKLYDTYVKLLLRIDVKKKTKISLGNPNQILSTLAFLISR